MDIEQLDTRLTFRLCERHKELIAQEARRRHLTSGDVLREIVRRWVAQQEKAEAPRDPKTVRV